jgi:hypothetical protein
MLPIQQEKHMHRVNIHYDRIGTIPQVEAFRHKLPQLLTRYEASSPPAQELQALTRLTGEHRKAWVDEVLKDGCKTQRIVDGLTIISCAEHFYGVMGSEFDSIADLIDVLRGLDDTLKVK